MRRYEAFFQLNPPLIFCESDFEPVVNELGRGMSLRIEKDGLTFPFVAPNGF